MDTVWLKDFLHFKLAPGGLDYVGINRSVDEDEQVHLKFDLLSSLLAMSEVSYILVRRESQYRIVVLHAWNFRCIHLLSIQY
jgi:hypothetical protein